MKVHELKEILADLPDDMIIVLSRDAEGNHYSPLANWAVERYLPDSSWCGMIVCQEDVDEHYYDESDLEAADPALIFWPIN